MYIYIYIISSLLLCNISLFCHSCCHYLIFTSRAPVLPMEATKAAYYSMSLVVCSISPPRHFGPTRLKKKKKKSEGGFDTILLTSTLCVNNCAL